MGAVAAVIPPVGQNRAAGTTDARALRYAAPPEAAAGGPLSRVRDGHLVTVDAETGVLHVHVDDLADRDADTHKENFVGTGRELFASMRRAVSPADLGASVFGSLS